MRLAIAVVAVVVGVAGTVPASGSSTAEDAEEAARAAAPEPAGSLEAPDLTQPSQAVFRDWPPAALLERPYWLPWGPLAFQRAALFDRPVLFVMTVRWNRVAQKMAMGTLSDPGVQRAVNAEFVSVLVNADRRPDIALRYGTGGWPVIALLNADGNPMLSQANERKVAMPITIGPVAPEPMKFLLGEGAFYHRKWGEFLLSLGQEWARREGETTQVPGAVDEGASDAVARWMLANRDAEAGGFGAAPKFLVPGLTEYAALRAARQAPALTAHAAKTLDAMIASPLHDREHGGIHRAAGAPEWGDIQYEKMLDRNAAFLRELTESLRLNPGQDARLDAARGTARFLLDTLARPGGGFYLAQVADPASGDGGGWWRGETPADDAPPLDRLVLAGPNAEAGAALIRAGTELGEPSWVEAGRRAIDVVLERGRVPGRGMRHVIEPSPEEFVFLETQADVAFALLDAYEATGRAGDLETARDIVDFAVTNLSTPGETGMLDRLPEPGAIGLLANPRRPLRSNARIARAMLRLAAHGAGADYRDQAIAVLSTFSGDLGRYGAQATDAALAIEEAVRSPLVLRVEGPAGDPRTIDLRSRALAVTWPWRVVATGADGPDAAPAVVASLEGRETRLATPADVDAFAERMRALMPASGTP